MASYAYRQEPSAPPMYPEVNDIRPVLPVRSELNRHPQEETLLPPRVPERMDKPTSRSPVDAGLRRNDFAYNYNRYATKKTIGHFFMILALLTSNVMQLRTLILQKQHDSIWIISLVLACISILFQIGLIFILYIIAKGDIRNSQKQIQLERYNNFALIIIIFIAIINVIINIFMLTINSKSFLDTRALEILQNQN
ncbi:unnamed protein product [Rotaria sordida]|uniref:Ninjurin-2 n=1 Tax=Rotaria sordida TaxID=392033 RepID=A0A814P3U9_9BILA|nr:unnamed protein product [Rotaria sordida]CAF1359852.1 unnamed protein product [Rotaria sordida]